MAKENANYTTTCVNIRKENAEALARWAKETGMSKNAIINMMISDMIEHPRALTMKVELK